MRNLTAQELWVEANAVCDWLVSHKGYDSASVQWISIREDSMTFELTYIDDFQHDADSSMRYHSGSYMAVNLDSDESLWAWAAALPSRTKRETSFLIRQLKPIASAAAQVKDLEIQEIIQSILGANTSLHNLLEDARVEAQAEAESDNPDFKF